MATSRERFALDWIQGELLETLNAARAGLEAYAEALDGGGNDREATADALRECVMGLHQVHGTLVMLELKGVTLLADHLELLADHLRNGNVADINGACQILMQGILELPAHLEELQSGMPDSEASMLPMVNELRRHLGEPALDVGGSGINLHRVADETAIRRFEAIDGVEKTRKIRGVYQQVLLKVLKGGDLAGAVDTLRKVAQGMAKICEGTPFAAQWQAFGEFVESLALTPAESTSLDGAAVKLLRRIDSEIREIVRAGARALRRPVSINVVRQLLEAAVDRGRSSPLLDELRTVAAQGGQSEALSLSGRQAMVTAARALREELGTIKDRLDLFVRGGAGSEQLRELLAPLKQVGSTLSILGFESSKSIVLDQANALASLVEAGSTDEAAILNVAGALVQVDENLASLTQSGQGEVEKITGEAQRAVARQTREDLEQVKQSIVDYISSQWDVRHLQEAPARLKTIAGALKMIPLTQAANLVVRCHEYLSGRLLAGHVPTWEELDCLADVLSGIDYYLERLASDKPSGAGDILEVVHRSLQGLAVAGGEPGAGADTMAPTPGSAAVGEAAAAAEEDVASPAAETTVPGVSDAESAAPVETEADVAAIGEAADEEPELTLEAEEDFDLANPLFDEVSGKGAEPAQDADRPGATGPEDARPEDARPEDARPEDAQSGSAEWQLEIDDEEEIDLGSAQLPRDGLPEQELTAAAGNGLDPLDDALDAFMKTADQSEPAEASDRTETVGQELSGSDNVIRWPGGGAPPPAAETPSAPEAAGVQAPPQSAKASTLVDDFESDTEIVEIFVEEVDDVLGAVDESLDAWEAALSDEAHLGEIRRAFHTLKGSGRMVGANILGEVAWSVENMLNRVIDGTVAPTPEFVTVVRRARALTPQLKAAFESRSSAPMADVGRIMEQADVLASGGSLAETDAQAPAGRAAEPAVSAAQPSASADERVETAQEDDRSLFLGEAASHLHDLEAACRDDGFVLADDVMHALHTLAGSAAMAGAAGVGEIASPAYDLARALRRPGKSVILTGEQAEFFREATRSMVAMVGNMRASRASEDPFQLIADADRLLAETGWHPADAANLLGLPAVTVVTRAGDLLDDWREGAVDMTLADEVREALADIERAAREQDQPTVAALAGALLGAHERFEFETLSERACQELKEGHEALLAQLDALAADQNPASVDELCKLLDALRPAPEGAEDAATDGGQRSREVLAGSAEVAEPDRDQRAPVSSEALDDASGGRDFELDLEAEALPRAEQPAGPEWDDARPPVQQRPAVDRSLLPDDLDEEIIGVFFEEADEILEALDHSINDWADEPENRLHLENLLRGLHTLKGGARLSGLARLGDDTHEFESYLIDFQEGARLADSDLFVELHRRYDALAALLGRIRAAVAGEAPAMDAAPRAAARDEAEPPAVTVEPGKGSGPGESVPADAPVAPVAVEPVRRADAAPPPDNVEPLRRPAVTAAESPAEAARTGGARPEMAQEGRQEEARKGVARPEEGRKGVARPEEGRQEGAAAQARAQEMVRVGAGLLETLVNLAGESSIIRARVEQGMSDFTGALDEMETTIDRLREQLRRLEIETEAQILFRQDRVEGPSYEDFDPLEMDRYSQLQQLSRALSESAYDMLDLKETLLSKARDAETLLLQQARVNTELQEGLMRSRMVPFNRLLPRLRRTVRQVARELGKDVELTAVNVEGELDRTLLERMVPPLEHMLRNAVDHGIEDAEERRARGKETAGHIELRLSREGGDVVIEISDDGAGIDVERVRAKAIERGLMAADASLRDEEITQFVLAPGFSTAKSVTQISGRGVGMDVVHSEVKQLGGSINILSQPGQGTRFVVRVPFTVSVNRALMVSVGDDLYAIPLNTIEGIVLLSAEELDQLYVPDGNTFQYAGVPYRVQYLGSFLGREYHAQPMRSSIPVVLVRSGEHAVAVHVDSVQGSREIVVKSLGPQFAGVGGISGATILGDGSVVVILDLVALIRSQSAGLGAGQRQMARAPRTRCVMVVDDSVTVRKVTSRLLERQGMDVVVAKDGVEAVSLLQERRPDVMLLDIEMPRMDGFEVLRQVRHDERLKDLPIVMISSRTGTKHQDRAAELGVSRFLGKPFHENELLATIDELVD